MTPFVHLHTHSHYSLLDGLGKIDDLVTRAKELGQTALALTDHGSLYGAVDFYQKAKKEGIKPIIGVETYVARRTHRDKEARLDADPFHLILLAQNATGYKNLMKLISIAHHDGYYYRPRIDHALLEKYHEGLIALSACLGGEVAKAITGNNHEGAVAIIERYQRILGKDNYFLEMQSNPGIPEQEVVNRALHDLSRKTGAPLVATNDLHYVRPEDKYAQDILLCVQTNKTVNDTDRMNFLHDDYSMTPTEVMMELFPNDLDAIERTAEIAERCTVDIPLGQNLLPRFDTPGGKSAFAYLRELCDAGLRDRYNVVLLPNGKAPTEEGQRYVDRLEYELGIIEKTGYADYFLIVQDYVLWAKRRGISVGPGRGSAAGSITSYLLHITDVDPIKYDLVFERFLNPARVSMPDIDMDFADDRRDEVLHYIQDRYGHANVAQIVTFGTMAARAAVRDAGRALGLPYGFCDMVAKLIPSNASITESTSTVPELKSLITTNADGKKLLEMAEKLEGVARHTSKHACGIVITAEPLNEHVPTTILDQTTGDVVTQYSLHPIEDLGLLKMDLLGLSNLTIIQNTLAILRAKEHIEIDLTKIPFDDPKTFHLFQEAQTTGVFQLESGGMKRYLRQLKPTDLEDIIAMIALYRPGPMQLIPDYIEGKYGRKQITYLHPTLEPVLKKTYGIAIYQEQVLEIAKAFCGFSYGEADLLRKAMGKKIKKLLDEQKEKFIAGAVKQGASKEIAEQIFAFIEPFAGYGFNRSHAVCYAFIAYQTAYLKAHYPAAFMAALLRSEESDVERIAVLINESRLMGIDVLPPDVNQSFAHFAVVDMPPSGPHGQPREVIRFGLEAIKNLGGPIAQAIIDERKARGPFASLSDFLIRLSSSGINRKSLEALAKSGAFDLLGKREELLAGLDSMVEFIHAVSHIRGSKQQSLFGTQAQTMPTYTPPRADPIPPLTILSWERELLGLYLSDHPVKQHAATLQQHSTPISDIPQRPVESMVRVGGVLTVVEKKFTRNKETMLFVTIEDLSGQIEAIVFPRTANEIGERLTEEAIGYLDGRINDKEGVLKLIADNFHPVDAVPPPLKERERTGGWRSQYVQKPPASPIIKPKNQTPPTPLSPSRIIITLPGKNPDLLKRLQETLATCPSGTAVVTLQLSLGVGIPPRMIPTRFSLSGLPDTIARITEIVGSQHVHLESSGQTVAHSH